MVALTASALTLKGSESVLVEDVCPTGAKLLGPGHVSRIGHQLLLKVGAIEILSSVVWVGLHECGILFEPPLSPDCLQLLKQEGQWATIMGL